MPAALIVIHWTEWQHPWSRLVTIDLGFIWGIDFVTVLEWQVVLEVISAKSESHVQLRKVRHTKRGAHRMMGLNGSEQIKVSILLS